MKKRVLLILFYARLYVGTDNDIADCEIWEFIMDLIVTEAHCVTDELVSAFQRLTPQISEKKPPPTHGELEQIISSPSTTLLVAMDKEQENMIVGTLTLVHFRIPTGLRAWIEDVVVDSKNRRKGIATALCHEAIARATQLGSITIDLTSRPSREGANKLYLNLGFAQRETNLYRYKLQ